jgi:hypothetical protein
MSPVSIVFTAPQRRGTDSQRLNEGLMRSSAWNCIASILVLLSALPRDGIAAPATDNFCDARSFLRDTGIFESAARYCSPTHRVLLMNSIPSFESAASLALSSAHS